MVAALRSPDHKPGRVAEFSCVSRRVCPWRAARVTQVTIGPIFGIVLEARPSVRVEPISNRTEFSR